MKMYDRIIIVIKTVYISMVVEYNCAFGFKYKLKYFQKQSTYTCKKKWYVIRERKYIEKNV